MPRLSPTERAALLLKETSLPAHEIAEMAGLDVYQVIGIKLKSRPVHSDEKPQSQFLVVHPCKLQVTRG